jgi:hypothetical protein
LICALICPESARTDWLRESRPEVAIIQALDREPRSKGVARMRRRIGIAFMAVSAAPTIRLCSTAPTPCSTRFRRCASWSPRARNSTKPCARDTSTSANPWAVTSRTGSTLTSRRWIRQRAKRLHPMGWNRASSPRVAPRSSRPRAPACWPLSITAGATGAGAGGDRAGRLRLLARAGGLELGGRPHLQNGGLRRRLRRSSGRSLPRATSISCSSRGIRRISRRSPRRCSIKWPPPTQAAGGAR